MSMTFGEWLAETHVLQRDSFGTDPVELEGPERGEFLMWNAFAATDELHEAMLEIKWKPWLTDGSRGEWVDRDAFVGELVDCLHFVANMLATANCDGEELTQRYVAKMQLNAKRQRDGYDGVKDADGRAVDGPVPMIAPNAQAVLEKQAMTRQRAAQAEHLRRQRQNNSGGSDDYGV